MSTGWVIGFGVGAAVVVVVVVLLLLMIAGMRAAAIRAESILAALHAARDNTQGLWEIERINTLTTRILVAATTARQALARRAGYRVGEVGQR
ncbi:MAG TPA: hypothetical protein VM324_16875 [Egibacteraceae bacterium]|jgi:hypothetical protein|nr:hypothetical protein [Egibacteraceae bacterium]